jgi:hypothetical protein
LRIVATLKCHNQAKYLLKHINGYTASFTELRWTLLVALEYFPYAVLDFIVFSLTSGDNCKVIIPVFIPIIKGVKTVW